MEVFLVHPQSSRLKRPHRQFRLVFLFAVVFSVFSVAAASEINFDQLIDEAANQQREVAADVHQQSGLNLQNKDKKITEVEISGTQGFKVKLKSDKPKKKHKKKRKPQSSSSPASSSVKSTTDAPTTKGPTPQ
jgi:hypothetical protein